MKSWALLAFLLPIGIAASGCSLTDPGSSGGCQASSLSGTATVVINPTTKGDELAQSFVATATESITTVHVKLARQGSPDSTIYVSIRGDAAGSPAPSDVSDPLGTHAAATLSTTATLVGFTLSPAADLVDGDTFWLVVRADYAASDVDNVVWVGSSTNVYSDGAAKQENLAGNAFLSISGFLDFIFEVGC